MIVERPRPAVLRLTAHVHEVAALITAARWVAEGRPGELPGPALDDLRAVLADYDEGLRREALARAERSSEASQRPS